MRTPYSVKIYLPFGEASGLRVLEIPNWTGSAVAFSRTGLDEAIQRPELQNAGVYILLGEISDDGSLPKIYIGEGDPVFPRLKKHNAEKDFWTFAVAFTANGNQLNKAHIQYIEHKLIQLATKRKLCVMDNGNIPQEPTISESDKAAMDEFILKMLGILPLLAINVFDEVSKPASSSEVKLYLKAKNIKAEAVQRATGFIVLKGSEASANTSSSCPINYINKRKSLLDSGKLKLDDAKFIFTEDTSFTSPSYASSVVLGMSSNGRDYWKNSNGVSIKEMLDKEVMDME